MRFDVVGQMCTAVTKTLVGDRITTDENGDSFENKLFDPVFDAVKVLRDM